MSIAGAKVLNAQAVQFAKEAQIAIYARSTFKPGKETIIRKLPSGIPRGVKAVVSESDVTRVRLHGEDTLKNFEWIMSFLEERQVTVKELNVAGVQHRETFSRASFIVSSKNVYGWEDIKETLGRECGRDIEFDTGLSALSLIGEGINRDNETLIETMRLLKSSGIPVVGAATTSFRISLLVPGDEIKESVRLCHRKWIEEAE
jgi:aspartate kinase